MVPDSISQPDTDRDRLGMVEQAVEDGGGEGGVVVEDLGPFLEHAIGRDHGRAALVSLADDLEEQVGADLIDGQVPQLVQDEDRRLKVLIELGLKPLPAYFDSAEPKSNAELQRMGLRIRPALKGPDSVRASIDFLRAQKIHILEGSPNLLREHNGYCWRKDRAGRSLAEPVEFDNHAIDAVRYGIFSHCSKPKSRYWSAQWGS